MNDFYDDLARGKRGEKLVYDALTARGSIITDLRDDMEARWNDIDFLLEKDGKQTTLEVKTDYASERTGNFFIEYENRNNKKHNYFGWYRYCKAEYLCFVQEGARKAYIVLLDELKQTIKKDPFRVANGKDAVGFLFPVSRLLELDTTICLEL
jgi:hypothetical protein